MNIGPVVIGPERPCVVVAEIGANHNGRLDLAIRLIEECASAGADLIKVQCYTPEEAISLRAVTFAGGVPEPWLSMGYTTLGALYAKAHTPHGWFPAMADTARQAGVPWFSTVSGLRSLELLTEMSCPAFKLSAWDEGAESLYRAVRATGKPIILSTRNPRPKDRSGHIVLFCPPGYPQDLKGLDAFATSTCDGLSYHGVDWHAPARAAAIGAKMVEVHVQLDDEPSELDAHSSLNVSDLARLCESVRMSEAA